MKKIIIITVLMVVFAIGMSWAEVIIKYTGEVHEDAHSGEYFFWEIRPDEENELLFILVPGERETETRIAESLEPGTEIKMKSTHQSILILDKYDSYTVGEVHPSTIELDIYWPSNQHGGGTTPQIP